MYSNVEVYFISALWTISTVLSELHLFSDL